MFSCCTVTPDSMVTPEPKYIDCEVIGDSPQRLQRPFHVLFWKNSQAMICNMYGRNSHPIEYKLRVELLNGQMLFGPNEKMNFVFANDGRKFINMTKLDNVFMIRPLELFTSKYRFDRKDFEWMNGFNINQHCLYGERNGIKYQFMISEGHIIDVLFTKEDMDVFEQLICMYLEKYLLRDLCKFVAMFM